MIPVNEVWKFWLDHKDELTTKYLCVADIPQEGIEIYITNDYGYPSFSVDVDGVTEQEEIAIDEEDAEFTYSKLLGKLFEDDDEIDDTSVDPDDDEMLSEDDTERVNEISDAAYLLLSVLLEMAPEDAGFDSGEVNIFAEDIEDMLAKKYQVFVRHPTVIRNKETGLPEVVQFPYE